MGHNYMGHNYIGHNYMGHNYMGHNYMGHNYRFASVIRPRLLAAPIRAAFVAQWRAAVEVQRVVRMALHRARWWRAEQERNMKISTLQARIRSRLTQTSWQRHTDAGRAVCIALESRLLARRHSQARIAATVLQSHARTAVSVAAFRDELRRLFEQRLLDEQARRHEAKLREERELEELAERKELALREVAELGSAAKDLENTKTQTRLEIEQEQAHAALSIDEARSELERLRQAAESKRTELQELTAEALQAGARRDELCHLNSQAEGQLDAMTARNADAAVRPTTHSLWANHSSVYSQLQHYLPSMATVALRRGWFHTNQKTLLIHSSTWHGWMEKHLPRDSVAGLLPACNSVGTPT